MTTILIICGLIITLVLARVAYVMVRGGADRQDFDPVEMDLGWNREDRE